MKSEPERPDGRLNALFGELRQILSYDPFAVNTDAAA